MMYGQKNIKLHCHLLPAPLYKICPHYLTNCTIFEKKKLLEIKCIFWFSVHNFCMKNFIIIEELSAMIKKMDIGLHVKYPPFLSKFNVTWIFSIDFRKVLKYQISWKSVQWKPSSMWTDRRTEKTWRSSHSLFPVLRTRLKLNNYDYVNFAK